jgi:phosphoserine phosphatase
MTDINRPRLTLFDLDHTLLPLDSDYEWGEFTIRIGWTDPVEFARRNAEFYAHYQAGTLDVHDYVRFATEAVRQRGPEAGAAAHAASCAR